MIQRLVAYPRIILSLYAKLLKLELFGLVMFALGGVYVSVLLTIPKLLSAAQRLL